MDFDMNDPMIQQSVKVLGEAATIEMLQKAEETDSTPICCHHCPYTDCSRNGTYNAEWLMMCSKYARYKRTHVVEKKKLTADEKIARLEKVVCLLGSSPRISDDVASKEEFLRLIDEIKSDLG